MNRGVITFGDETERDQALVELNELQEPYTCSDQNLNTLWWAPEPLILRSLPTSWGEMARLRYQIDRIRIQRANERQPNYQFVDRTSCSEGNVLMLPRFDQERKGRYIDPRIHPGGYGHPVIVTRIQEDNFVNIVIVSLDQHGAP